MHELLLDYGRQINKELLEKSAIEKAIKAMRTCKPSLHVRFLLGLSDLLLAIGRWIRPKDYQIYSYQTIMGNCEAIATTTSKMV